MKKHKHIIRIDPCFPDPDAIEKAAAVIRSGGVVGFPTRCLYGLGADALNEAAVNRIYQIKNRSDTKPVLVLIHRLSDLERLAADVSEIALTIMDRFWPGKITLVFNAKPALPAGLTAGTGKIGVRLCGHPVAAALIKAAGTPVTGTSANISGNAGCSDISNLEPELADQLDLMLDAGKLPGGAGSTIADVSGDSPVIIREGVIASKDIFSLFFKNSTSKD